MNDLSEPEILTYFKNNVIENFSDLSDPMFYKLLDLTLEDVEFPEDYKTVVRDLKINLADDFTKNYLKQGIIDFTKWLTKYHELYQLYQGLNEEQKIEPLLNGISLNNSDLISYSITPQILYQKLSDNKPNVIICYNLSVLILELLTRRKELI